MPLFKMIVAYDGARFNGFQRQITNEAMERRRELQQNQNKDFIPLVPKRPHRDTRTGKRKDVAVTIQDCLEDAIISYAGANSVLVTTEELLLRFAGRTDKGVHARGQVIVVTLPTSTCATTSSNSQSLDVMKKGINSRLPVDVSVERIEIVPNGVVFEPRHQVRRKIYSYTIKYRQAVPGLSSLLQYSLGPHGIRSAFDLPCLWVCAWALDDSVVEDICGNLQGEHNFRVFVHKDDRAQRDHILTVDRVTVERQIVSEKGEEAPIITARFEFEAKGFRRSMVRNMVGFCVDVCRGHAAVAALSWEEIWSGKDSVAVKINAAPACGLCLESVVY
jgi:tRNA pseudouridine(38-40) synthase